MTTNLNTKRAVIYCRVSTKEQAEEGNSLVTQEKTCKDYAEKHGYEIIQIYIEQGESAKTIDRTEFQKLLAFCTSKKNNIQAIIAYKIDRISRNTDDYSQIRMQLKRYNVEIKSTSEYFEDTPAGRFMENIIANVAQFDNEVRTERSVGGMRTAVLEGRYVWNAPVGYINSKIEGKSNIIPNKDRKYVEYIFEKAATTNESLEYIRKGVNTMGLPMQKSHFYKTLQTELYAGYISKFGLRVKGSFEPLVTESVFNKVQSILKRKRPKKIYEVENKDFPLRRFIRNEEGEFATGAWSQGRQKKYPYYYFRKAKESIKKETLEVAFATFLNKFAIAEKHLLWFIEKTELYLYANQHRFTTQNKAIYEQIDMLKHKRSTIAEKVLSGIFTDEIAKEQLQKIETEIFDLEIKIFTPKEYKGIPETLLVKLKQFLNTPGEYWLTMPYQVKLRFQRFNIPQGLVYEKNICRTTKLPNVFNTILEKFNQLSANVHFNTPQNEQAQKPISSPLQNEINIEELYELHNTLTTLAYILHQDGEEVMEASHKEVIQVGQ
jgi:site-specific DNA recombinase